VPASDVRVPIEGDFPDVVPRGGERVVGGAPAKLADWPSFVVIAAIDQKQKPPLVPFCGGTVIAPGWVLTAGRCVRVLPVERLAVIEGIDNYANPGAARIIGISEIVVHEEYSIDHELRVPHNDIALLRLKDSARSPAQALISRPPPTFSPPLAAVAGFGLTSPQKPKARDERASNRPSSRLMQVDLPIVATPTCIGILSKRYGDRTGRVVDDATICAGDLAGGKDFCLGDYGSPLVIKVGSRKVQIGVASWGPGCAQRDAVGVYASVSHFEAWIKRHVPEANFYRPSAQSESVAGAAPSSQPASKPPAPLSSAITDIETVAAEIGTGTKVRVGLVDGNRARVGGLIRFHLSSAIAGQLLVYNVDLVTGTAYQVFPNRYSNGAQAGGTSLQIAAGADITIPSQTDRFDVRVKEPIGKNRLYAFLVPLSVEIGDIAEKGMDMRELVDPLRIFGMLADRAVRGVDVTGRDEWGAAVYEYEIVK